MRGKYKRKAVAWYLSKPRGALSDLWVEMFGLEYWATLRYRYRRDKRWNGDTTWPLFDWDPKAGPMYNQRRKRRVHRKAWKR